MPDIIDVTGDVAHILTELGIRHAVGGSMASILHGEPRLTQDVDFIIELGEAKIPDVVRAFGNGYYIAEPAVRDAVQRSASFNVIHLATMLKADLYVAGRSVLDPLQIGRAIPMKLRKDSAAEIRVSSAEDIVLRKLEWYRKGREVSDRQWRDILGVLKVSGARLDRNFMATTAEAAGVTDLLERSIREAGLA
ncbi:MAG: hypothetical protein AAB074_00660 [Planctomycetota bacterium]